MNVNGDKDPYVSKPSEIPCEYQPQVSEWLDVQAFQN